MLDLPCDVAILDSFLCICALALSIAVLESFLGRGICGRIVDGRRSVACTRSGRPSVWRDEGRILTIGNILRFDLIHSIAVGIGLNSTKCRILQLVQVRSGQDVHEGRTDDAKKDPGDVLVNIVPPPAVACVLDVRVHCRCVIGQVAPFTHCAGGQDVLLEDKMQCKADSLGDYDQNGAQDDKPCIDPTRLDLLLPGSDKADDFEQRQKCKEGGLNDVGRRKTSTDALVAIVEQPAEVGRCNADGPDRQDDSQSTALLPQKVSWHTR